MPDEYVESKTRYYAPKKKEDRTKLSKYVVYPMQKVFNMVKPKDATRRRLEA